MNHFRLLLLTCGLVTLTGCVTDSAHVLYISVPDQQLELRDEGTREAVYPVSTSKFGLGDAKGSRRTPLGQFEVAKKFGGGHPAGTVFKDRKPTGEVLPPDAPGRDPIVTRILWLKGLEDGNRNAYKRYIYIHGTPEERNIGRPASYGCIRMRSADIIDLYDRIGTGARVIIFNAPLSSLPPPVTGGNPG